MWMRNCGEADVGRVTIVFVGVAAVPCSLHYRLIFMEPFVSVVLVGSIMSLSEKLTSLFHISVQNIERY